MKMNFICVNPTKKIVFHKSELNINETKLKLTLSNGQASLAIQNTQYDSIAEIYTINLNGDCTQNTEYSLSIEFIGTLRSELNGFYRSSYIDKNGHIKQ